MIYGSRLRVAEVARLRIKDILSDTMQVRVDNAKHGTNRYTILSHTALIALKEYFRAYFVPGEYARNDWLFPSRDPLTHINVSTIKSTIGRRGVVFLCATSGLPQLEPSPKYQRGTFGCPSVCPRDFYSSIVWVTTPAFSLHTVTLAWPLPCSIQLACFLARPGICPSSVLASPATKVKPSLSSRCASTGLATFKRKACNKM